MKVSKTLENRELSKRTLESIEDVVEKIISQIVDDYENQLLKDGKYLSEISKRALKKYLKIEASVKLSVSLSVNEKKLSEWEIYPVEAGQTLLMPYPERTENKNTVLRAPDETLEECEERKQLIKDEQFRAERASRAEAQA